jgi:hypothetical protein
VVREGLTIEWLPGTQDPEIEGDIEEACRHAASLLGVEAIEEFTTWVSFLPAHTDAPWRIGRAGYCVDKYPFDKVCLPERLLKDPFELREAMAHEFAHVIVLHLGRGRVPVWLNEAIAMHCGGRVDPRAVAALRTGVWPWRAPHALDAAFQSDHPGEIQAAYTQAALLGDYLAPKGRLGDLLRILGADNWGVRWRSLLGADPVDLALRTFGLGLEALFQGPPKD